MGQNAGVVDIGGGWAVTFKVESHNHPSFVEPYQGAATGVGGIVRDIISMGARPIAVMDQLRFGDVGHADTARVVHGVVAGVGLRLHVGQLGRQIGVLHVLNPMRKLGAHIDIAHKVSFASSGFPQLLGRDRARRGHSPRAAGIRPMRRGHAPALQPGFPIYAAHCKRHAAEAREPDSISAVARRMTRRRRDPR